MISNAIVRDTRHVSLHDDVHFPFVHFYPHRWSYPHHFLVVHFYRSSMHDGHILINRSRWEMRRKFLCRAGNVLVRRCDVQEQVRGL